jgi:hypothetical protein
MYRLSSSRSRSKSPAIPSSGVVEFITSFGGDSDNEGAVHGPTLPPQQMRKKVSSSLRYVIRYIEYQVWRNAGLTGTKFVSLCEEMSELERPKERSRRG